MKTLDRFVAKVYRLLGDGVLTQIDSGEWVWVGNDRRKIRLGADLSEAERKLDELAQSRESTDDL